MTHNKKIKFERNKTEQSKFINFYLEHARPLTLLIFLTVACLYFMVNIVLNLSYFDSEVFTAKKLRMMCSAFGFMVMSWACVFYWFKDDVRYQKLIKIIIVFAAILMFIPLFYLDEMMYSLVFMGMSLYWLKLAFTHKKK